MASDVGVGDAEIPWLDVEPADETTVATLTVHSPDGTATAAPVTAGPIVEGRQRWTANTPVVFTVAGRWVLAWQVTGTGMGAEPREVWVVASPVAGGPVWTPGRSRVANYTTGRTLVPDPVSGGNRTVLTYDSTTHPPGVVVDRLIADAVTWVSAATGEVHESLHELAGTVAALFAASSVELAYPDRSTEVKESARNVAEDLLRRAERMRADLVAANTAAGAPPVGVSLLPRWSFPPAPRWGDLDL